MAISSILSIKLAHYKLRLISCFYICDVVVVKSLYSKLSIHKEQFGLVTKSIHVFWEWRHKWGRFLAILAHLTWPRAQPLA